MIIDAHVHVYPDQGGDELGRSTEDQHSMMQAIVADFWGRMVTSHTDERFIPEPDEDVQFSIDRYGRWTWNKHGEQCWLQRGTPSMTHMEHSPEQLITTMDAAGVEYGVIQTDIEYITAEHGRDHYFRDCVKRWGHRLLATVALDYNLGYDDGHLDQELAALNDCADSGFRGVYLSGVGLPEPLDDPRCDSLWREIVRLKLPAYVQTGFCDVSRYRDQLRGLRTVLERHPELQVIDAHLGGNLVHPDLPGHTNIIADLSSLLESGQFFLELGYVLGFENEKRWGDDAIYPFPKHNEIAKAVYDRYGASVLVWGSDVPWCYRVCTYAQAVDLVRKNTPYMTPRDRDAVLGGNMRTLFGLDTPSA
jgi:predicted TIM-barrel fold metal-dependent hydrolase